MCGISGIVEPPQNSEGASPWYSRTIGAMNRSLHHRGPDGEGIWQERGIALGHTRLAILDLSTAANQPMHCPHSRYVLTYNGEVYNYSELRKELHETGAWNSSGDTEVVLRTLATYGDAGIEKLEGMFAFGLWDRIEKRLVLVRDRFGIKPLYYTFDSKNGRLIFSSEIRGIFAAGVAPRANLNKVAQFLVGGALDYDDQTWFQGIHSVPPGAFISFHNQKLSTHRYYDLVSRVQQQGSLKGEQFHQLFSQRVQQSISRCLQSDRPVGIHLSGGVDSSLIALIASHKSSVPLIAYSFGYEEPQYDESKFGREVASALGLSHHTSILKPEEIPYLTLKVLLEEGEPFTSFRQLSHHKVYKDFQSDGPTVVLEGSGGDELGAGYRAHLIGAYLDRVASCGEVEAMQWLRQTNSLRGMTSEEFELFLNHSLLAYRTPGLAASDGTASTDVTQLSADFYQKWKGLELRYPHPFESHLKNQQYLDIVYSKLPRGLRYIERASMSAGREARVPLLDHHLVELGIAASNEEKIAADGVGRAFFRSLFDSDTYSNPDLSKTLYGVKRSIADPQRSWMKNELIEYIQGVIASAACRERGILDSDRIIQTLNRFNPADPSSNSLTVFQPFITELWFQTFIDQPLLSSEAS